MGASVEEKIAALEYTVDALRTDFILSEGWSVDELLAHIEELLNADS